MLALLYLAASVVLGFWLTYLTRAPLRLEERLAFGTAVGLAVTTLAAFVLALLAGLSPWLLAFVGANAGAAGIIGLIARPKPVQDDWRDFKGRSRAGRFWGEAGVFGGVSGLLLLIFSHAIFMQDGVIYAGFPNVWGDWNQHLAQTAGFAFGENLPPTLTTMSGHKLTYPFMTNFLSALMVKGGLPLLTAMKVPAMLLAVAGVGMVMAMTRALVGGAAATLAPVLFYFAGGLGFINAIDDLLRSNQSLFTFLANQPNNYTQAFDQGVVQNLDWLNPIFAYVVPQRAFLFGLPLLLGVITLLAYAIRERSRGIMLAAGLTAALLPFVHTHALVFLGFLFLPLVWLTRRQVAGHRRKHIGWRDLEPWAYFLAPIVVLALPQFLWLTAGVDSTKSLRPILGWANDSDHAVWFWLKNAGLFLPLLAVAFWKLPRQRAGLWKPFAGAALGVFIISNLVVFQPWEWDNSKLLAYWLLLSVPGVAAWLVLVAQRMRFGKLIAGTLVVLLCAAGALDVGKAVNWQRSKVEMFGTEAQRIAAAVRARTEPDSVFLTAQDPNNAISGIAGRRIVLGYVGWIWSYGIDYGDREFDIGRMFSGSEAAPELLKKYDVDYVVIGPAERAEKRFQVNEQYFAERYEVWQRFDVVTIYDLNRPR